MQEVKLYKNNTWEVVELRKEKKTIDTKWVFTIIYKSKNSIERHKVRLLAKRYTHMV